MSISSSTTFHEKIFIDQTHPRNPRKALSGTTTDPKSLFVDFTSSFDYSSLNSREFFAEIKAHFRDFSKEESALNYESILSISKKVVKIY